MGLRKRNVTGKEADAAEPTAAENKADDQEPKSDADKPAKGYADGTGIDMVKVVLTLILALMGGWVWNKLDSTDVKVRFYIGQACESDGFKCAGAITPNRRTMQPSRPIGAGTKLIEINRTMQFWDLDALRDDFVKTELLGKARHAKTNNHLSSGAYLASWIARQYLEHFGEENKNVTAIDRMRRFYLYVLPVAEDLAHHPILWEEDELVESLSPHSYNFAVAMFYRDMVKSEYDALSEASSDFANTVNYTIYATSRVNVLSRAFSPGPLGEKEISAEEMQKYQTELDIDFSKGCHAMVPLLDMLNHHPNPNVAYEFVDETSSFLVTAKTGIQMGYELMDSYGKYSDPHLFAKYGFVNGDGSGHTQTTIALFHRLLDFDMKSEFSHVPRTGSIQAIKAAQGQHLRKYLQYDDGYESCIPGREAAKPEEWELKQLKLQHLVKIANDLPRWTVILPPRNPASKPAEAATMPIMEQPPQMNPSEVRINLSGLLGTCRLMSLNNDDYDGKAIQVLKENLETPDFVVEAGIDALEHRALNCIARLASTALMNYKKTVQEEFDQVATLNAKDFGSRDWTTTHLRLAEMQSLQLVSGAAFSQVKANEGTGPAYTLRESPCPQEFWEAL